MKCTTVTHLFLRSHRRGHFGKLVAAGMTCTARGFRHCRRKVVVGAVSCTMLYPGLAQGQQLALGGVA